MEKIRVAVVGLGNVGKYAVEAILSADDMELAGIVRSNCGEEVTVNENGHKITGDITKLGKVDVAVLTSPTRQIEETAKKILSLGISTVDSFDIHSDIVSLRNSLSEVAKANGAVAVISAGWDPGTDSTIRALFETIAPKGVSYTNFGPGMSMGHTVCVKSKEGVLDALSLTIPLGTGIHRRIVYVALKEGADINKVTEAIKQDSYFIKDETHVIQVPNVEVLKDMGHGVSLTRKGISSGAHNQMFNFDMRINNPAATAQVMIGSARAATRLNPGAYTIIEIPVIDFIEGDRESIIKRLV